MDAPGSKTLLLVARIGRRDGRSLFPLLDMLLGTELGTRLENATPMHQNAREIQSKFRFLMPNHWVLVLKTPLHRLNGVIYGQSLLKIYIV